MHNALAPNLGKIGVLVALESAGGCREAAGTRQANRDACRRRAPRSADIADVDAKSLERERDILTEQAKASGKPDDIIAKMVEGRIRKYYEEVVLLEQIYVVDGENRIAQVVENAAKTLGAPVKLTGFVRYQLGEGIEKDPRRFRRRSRENGVLRTRKSALITLQGSGVGWISGSMLFSSSIHEPVTPISGHAQSNLAEKRCRKPSPLLRATSACC